MDYQELAADLAREQAEERERRIYRAQFEPFNPYDAQEQAADAAREEASTICEETRRRWATREELIEMAHKDAEDHHAKGYDICTVGNTTYDDAYRARRMALADDTRAFEMPVEEHTSDDPIPGCVCANCQPVTAASIICAEDIIARLLALPREIEREEIRLADAEWQVVEAKVSLQRIEDDLLTTSSALIDGKNEAIRAAQVRAHTEDQRERLKYAEENLRAAKVHHHKVTNEFSAWKHVARLLEGERE
jgi:hypothetical protein